MSPPPRRANPAPEQAPQPGGQTRVRTLALAALCPLVAGYAVLAALLALVVATAPGARFAPADVLLAAGPTWLAAAQVPIDIAGHPLGVLPLLLTVLLLVLAERAAAGAADRLGPGTPVQALVPVGTVAGAHAVFGALLAILCGAGPVTAAPAAAFFVCGIFAGLAAAVGVRGHYGLLNAVTERLDPVVRTGIRAGLRGLLVLCAAGSLVYLVALLASYRTVGTLFAAAAPDLGSGIGLVLLSLAYLPNVLIGATSFLLGPGFSLGAAHASPFAFTGAAVPAFPPLAALPEHYAPWWPVLLLVPLAVGSYVGLRCRRCPAEQPVRRARRIVFTGTAGIAGRCRAVGVAALTVAGGCLVLAALAGGALGGGAYGPAQVPAGLLAVIAFCWIGFPGIIVTAFGAWRATEEAIDEDTADAGDATDAGDTGDPAGAEPTESEEHAAAR